METSNRPPFIVPQYRSGIIPSARRQNELALAINRTNTGIMQPIQVIPDNHMQVRYTNISITIDGGGSVISSTNPTLGGATVEIPLPGTIINWTVEADASGTIAVDVTRANQAVPSSSLVGTGNKPALSTAQYASALPSGWTSVFLAQGDIIGFAISGTPVTVKRITVTLRLSY